MWYKRLTEASVSCEGKNMSQKIANIIEDAIGRRAFLRQLSAATTAFISAVFFGPGLAEASGTVKVGCCDLCKHPSTCSYSGCTCQWRWQCCRTCHPQRWSCEECIQTPISPCGLPCQSDPDCGTKAQCAGVKCSRRVVVANDCPGPFC